MRRGAGTIAGEVPKEGFYVKPTLFAGVDPAHRLAQDEIFDPVQVVIRFSEGAEAIRIASGPTDWSRGGRQMRLVRALRSGQIFVNNYGAGGGVQLLFGEVKLSGHASRGSRRSTPLPRSRQSPFTTARYLIAVFHG